MSNGIKWSEVKPIDKPNIIIVASGPSLQGFDFNKIRNENNFIITINDAGKHVSFADAWFTLDPWGLNGPQLPPKGYAKQIYAAVPDNYGRSDSPMQAFRYSNDEFIYLHRLASHNKIGITSDTAYKLKLSEDNSCISTGNSGYGAFNLAYHMRPKKILLLGLDGTKGYFYDKNYNTRPLVSLPQLFESTKEQIERAGIKVRNASLESVITTYPRISHEDALKFLVE